MKTLVLLDTHALIHRAYHALPPFTSKKTGEPTGALYGLSTMLLKSIRELKPDYIVAAYDRPEPTFRHTAYDQYKAKRPEAEDDLVKQLIRSHDVVEAFGVPILSAAGFEADDILGTIVEQTKKIKNIKTIIVSGDMDVLQLVDDDKVVVYTMRKGIEDTVTYDEEKVIERFGFGPELITDFKGLKGDPSDNIVGVKGIGEKTATDIIKNFGTLENLYKKLDKKLAPSGGSGILKERVTNLLLGHKEDAFFSKILATIRRDAPIKFELPKTEYKLDKGKLKAMFEELGFNSLVKRLEQENPPTKERKPSLSSPSLTKGGGKGEGLSDTLPLGLILSFPNADRDKSFWSAMSKADEIFILNQGKIFFISVKDKNWQFEESFYAKKKKEWNKIFAEKMIILPDAKGLIKILSYQGLNSPKRFFDCNIAAWAAESTNKSLEIKNINEVKSVYKKLIKEIKEKKLDKILYEIEFPIISILAEMEVRGIAIDKIFLSKFKKEIVVKSLELEKKIYDLAGGSFNINSPMQVGEIIFKKLNLKAGRKTKTGRISTKESELLKLKDSSPIVSLILDYRELAKLLSTYVGPLKELSKSDGKIHTTFNQTGTVTGRLSSDSPNLQNIPIRSDVGAKIRNAFIASPGHTFAAFDYSQIELKILAAMSGDEKMIEAFKSGTDIHRFTASNIYNVSMEKVTPKMRGHAKTINFGIVYGMGVRKLAQSTGMGQDEAKKFYAEYFHDFPKVRDYIAKIKIEVKKNGFVETLFGRRRYFDLKQLDGGYLESEIERMAVNAVIQGTDADIVKLAMSQVAKEFGGRGIFPILQIHDELLYEIKDDTIKEIVPRIRLIMENVCNSPYLRASFHVPLSVDIKIGKRWGSLKSYGFK